jgi:Kef-type K+ transport system membrane component KefB/nucleotide-binding universal stress UspA family protein
MTFQPGFLVSIVVILLGARLLGEAAQRLGQPPVFGQLVAGILLGPSLLGAVSPQLEQALFPPDPSQKAALHAFAEFGVLLLLVLTGMESSLRLMERLGRPALSVPLAGVAVPFLCGAAFALALPSALIPDESRRLATALFLGVALSISSVKIVASVLRDMNFERRDLGQILVASSTVEDSLGWIMIAAILGIVRKGAVDIGRIGWTVGGLALFLAASLTLGRRLVVNAVRIVNDLFLGEYMTLTLILVVMGVTALITQALGVQTVLGALIAGVLIGESPILTKAISAQLRAMVAALFAPVFFALAGLSVDLTALMSPDILAMTAALVLIASLGKFLGAFVGGALGRLSATQSLALAIGMNARGSTEVIVASVGLSAGALTPKLYSMIVTMAVLTTCAMPPALRWALARTPLRPGEKERLEKEAFEAKGFVANMDRFLLAASDHPNGRLASRLVGLLAGARGKPTTLLHVQSHTAKRGQSGVETEIASDLRSAADRARESRASEAPDTPSVAVKARASRLAADRALSEEAPKGYDFLVIGLDPAQMPAGGFNPEIAASARSFKGPVAVAVARGGHKRNPAGAPLKILAPVTGAPTARRAAEVAIELAHASASDLEVLFISSPAGASSDRHRRRALTMSHEEAALKEVVEIADQHNQPIRVRSRSSTNWRGAILSDAEKGRATLIVLGVTIRPSDAMLFGETANQLLEASRCSLLFVAS